MLLLVVFSLLAGSTLGAECGQQRFEGKRLFCYLEGKRSPQELDPCPCSHLLLKNVQVDSNSEVLLPEGAKKDLEALKSVNPSMSILLSLGGSTVTSRDFRTIVSNKNQLSNFTASLNSLYSDGTIQGMELDWEWPMESDDKKDKIKLIRYVRQVKLATGANVRRRLRRDAEDDEQLQTTEGSETTTTTTFLYDDAEFGLRTDREDEEPLFDDITVDLTTESSAELTPTTMSDFEVEDEDEVVEEEEEDGSFSEATTENWRARGAKRRRRPTTASPTTASYSVDDELNSLEDLYLEELESAEEGFVVVLRLSPEPFHLVKGYEFKMLNKFVDYYTLHSYNITRDSQNVTYHHSRLMGVSDIHNTDALIDVVTGLGAPLNKLILTTPAMANTFNLVDPERNLPGSAVNGLPTPITYQQVCQLLARGEWTLEREEDLTGPYTYMANKWIAFDDDTSLKIKAKYVLLRELAGLGLVSIDADDVDNVCGKGRHSLLNTLSSVVRSLARKPRQLIVSSLEEDLLATASTSIPVAQARGLRVSPYRIVRIVDREGEIQSIRENSETTLECSRQGYYRHPEDCSRFYRCVKFNQYENDYTIFEYGCPNGLVFDDRWEVCVWPSQATPCDGSSEIFPIPKNEYVCPGEGFFVDPENCRWFFACRDHLGDGTFTHYEFRCPFGLAFDEENLRCEWPWLVSACANSGEYSASLSLPSRKDFVASYQPAGASSPYPAVPSIPPFESSRTPNGLRTGAASNGNIVRDGCENCHSPVLTITGHGVDNGNGIEVAAPARGPGYGPSTPAYSTTVRPPPPTTAYGSPNPEYGNGYDNAAAGSDGYEYPVPSNPLQYGPSTTKPYHSTTAPPTYRPSPSYSTTTQPQYQPSYGSSAAPGDYDNYDAEPSDGYNYPVPSNPLEYGISVNNPGENGLISAQPVTPNIPAYGSVASHPTTVSPVSTTYGTPVSTTLGSYVSPSSYRPPPTPAYTSGKSSYPPVYSTTYAPPVSSTYGAPVVSTTYAPAVSSTYGAPAVSTTYAPAVSSTYGAPSNYNDESYGRAKSPYQEPEESYGLPQAPVLGPAPSAPAETYGVPYAPAQSSYGEPSEPAETYGVPYAPAQSSYAEPSEPAETYGVPYAPAQTSYAEISEPSETYGVPYATAQTSYEEPSEPVETYGVPYAPAQSSYAEPSEPAETYGVPYAPVDTGYDEYEEEPAETYGVPSAPVVDYNTPAYHSTSAPTYKPPTPRVPEPPAETYGVPLSPVSTKYTPEYEEEPLPTYGVTPAPPVYQSSPKYNNGSPTPKPFVSFGSPTPQPVYHITTPKYTTAKPYDGPSKTPTYNAPSAKPAHLPPSWPQYPSEGYDEPAPVVKELPSPPQIQYGGFKAPSVPEPSQYKPQYQLPEYNPTPGRGHTGPKLSFGGFKAIPNPVPAYPTTQRPYKNPTTPYVPPYSQSAIKSLPQSGYSYPKPNNPLSYPTTSKPTYTPTPAPYPSSTPNLPAYGSTARAPAISGSHSEVSSGYEYPVPNNPLQYPSPSPNPPKQPSYSSPTPKPFVDFGSPTEYQPPPPQYTTARPKYESPRTPAYVAPAKPVYSSPTPAPYKPQPSAPVKAPGSGYKYPAPSNPLQYPNRDAAEVASVIPSGFSSATLSNGPFSSSGNAVDVDSRPGHPKPFVNVAPGKPVDAYGSGSHSSPQYSDNDDLPVYGGRGGKSFEGNNAGNKGKNGFGVGNKHGHGQESGNGGLRGNTGSSNFGGHRGNAGPGGNTAFGGNRGNNGFGGQQGNRGHPTAGASSGLGHVDNRGAGAHGGHGGANARPGGNGGFGAPGGNGGFGGPGGKGGFSAPGGNGGFGGPGGKGGNGGPGGKGGFGGSGGNGGVGGFGGNGGVGGPGGKGGFGGSGDNGGFGGSRGHGGHGGFSGNGGFGGHSGAGRGSSGNRGSGGSHVGHGAPQDHRTGKQVGDITSVKRPLVSKPAVLGKLAGNNWDLGIWEKFGPGGFRSFNETLGPEVCQRPGLFRHPTDCTQFYECYWDKWIERFTLHIFPCPVAMAVRQYDESISACNWPFLGPNCEGNTII